MQQAMDGYILINRFNNRPLPLDDVGLFKTESISIDHIDVAVFFSLEDVEEFCEQQKFNTTNFVPYEVKITQR